MNPFVEPPIFVLWSAHFEEAAASLFVSGLRAAALPVKLVGLTRPPASGAHGLTLVPDLTINEALAAPTALRALIVPCGTHGAPRLADDPRIAELLDEAAGAGALILIGPLSRRQRSALDDRLPGLRDAQSYPTTDDLIPFVRALATHLGAGQAVPHTGPERSRNVVRT